MIYQKLKLFNKPRYGKTPRSASSFIIYTCICVFPTLMSKKITRLRWWVLLFTGYRFKLTFRFSFLKNYTHQTIRVVHFFTSTNFLNARSHFSSNNHSQSTCAQPFKASVRARDLSGHDLQQLQSCKDSRNCCRRQRCVYCCHNGWWSFQWFIVQKSCKKILVCNQCHFEQFDLVVCYMPLFLLVVNFNMLLSQRLQGLNPLILAWSDSGPAL